MLKKLSLVVLSLGLIFGVVAPSFAKSYKVFTTPTPTPSPNIIIEKINSFELFWPMVAGKTIESKLYFIKLFKERVRGFFIFGKAQKADYEVFLGVKRVLEAELLLTINKKDLVGLTLDNAANEFDKAKTNLEAAKKEGNIPDDIKNGIIDRKSELKKLLLFLISQYPDSKDKLQVVLDHVSAISL